MMGTPGEPGVIPLAINEIFTFIEASENMEFLLQVSCMEIYNETITDLFEPTKTNLKIKENLNGDIYVGDLTEIAVASPEEVLELLRSGLGGRHVAATKMNDTSSRSHTVFKVKIESRVAVEDSDGAVRVAALNLVDLAGSERVANTGAHGDRLKEAGHINTSLLTLGSVIGKLSEGVKDSIHIPYRDSKLTRILQNSLGGNTRSAVICAMTPATQHVEETLSSLKFATRAKKIKNDARVNEVLDDEAQMKRYKRTIAELENKVQALQNETQFKQSQQLSEELAAKERLCKEQNNEMERLKGLIMKSGEASPRRAVPLSRKGSRRKTWCPGRSRGRLSIAGGVQHDGAQLLTVMQTPLDRKSKR